jgi:hypothetical protein
MERWCRLVGESDQPLAIVAGHQGDREGAVEETVPPTTGRAAVSIEVVAPGRCVVDVRGPTSQCPGTVTDSVMSSSIDGTTVDSHHARLGSVR